MLLGLVSEVFHLYFSLFVEVTFVAHKHLYSVRKADTFHNFYVVRNTLERGGGVDGVNNNDCVRTVKKVLVQSCEGWITRSIPNV